MKEKSKLKILIIAIVIAISSIFTYKGAIAPKLYDKYLNEGIKYLTDGNYEEAILAFDKAIKIESKSTEARVYQSKAYIGNEEFHKAVNVLEEAQNIDMTNEELLKEILEILNEIDSDIAYEFLDRFIDAVGEDNISQDIRYILASSNEAPSEPIADPQPGKYINPIAVKLKLDKIKVGHSYYYTLDGTHPNKESEKYRGQIDISESTTIKLIGYNKNDESTDVITLEYIIDEDILENVKNNISEGETLIDETVVGNEVGNISQQHKDKLQIIINEAKDLLNKDSIDYQDANKIKNEIENAIEEFKNNIIQPTDKSKLNSAINKAQDLYNNSVEGSSQGQYKSGSKSILLKSINKAKEIYKDVSSKQNDIDNQVTLLNKAIKDFQNSLVETFNLSIAMNWLDVYTKDLDESKKQEFDSIGLTCEFYKREYSNGTKNGKKYYDIISGFDAYTKNGELIYNEVYDEYTDKLSAAAIYRVYEDRTIDIISTID